MADEVSALDSRGDIADFCEELSGEIEVEIERMGIALGIDWNDEIQVQGLAKEALEHAQEAMSQYTLDHSDYRQKAKVTLFGLAAIMMDIMAKSAGKGIHTHGGMAWKAFSKALMKESGMPMSSSDNQP